MAMWQVRNAAFVALIAAGLGTASAEESILDRCWAPQALAATTKELESVRNHAKLNLAALNQEPLPVWFEQEALRNAARNLWVCASSFNVRALRFYSRHGFAPTATLPGLVAEGFDEILLRKFPLR
jgi:hypothetical protein